MGQKGLRFSVERINVRPSSSNVGQNQQLPSKDFMTHLDLNQAKQAKNKGPNALFKEKKYGLSLEKGGQPGLKQLESKASKDEGTNLVNSGAWGGPRASITLMALRSKEIPVMYVRANKGSNRPQKEEILRKTHGATFAASLASYSSQSFNAENLVELAVTPTYGILDLNKHLVVMFKENAASGGEQDMRPKLKSDIGQQGSVSNLLTSGSKLNGSNKRKKLKRIIRDKGSPFKVSSHRVPLAKSVSNMVELLLD